MGKILKILGIFDPRCTVNKEFAYHNDTNCSPFTLHTRSAVTEHDTGAGETQHNEYSHNELYDGVGTDKIKEGSIGSELCFR